ncbi:MAG: DinB family protein [Anaerolineae bacterium]|nr:DinB family protein [Anaerolineae bacterium]NIN94988.1 DinB family protein [Anaerolineae bacterium]NIQ78029.1 DinB family protein [Anaerolineae bacterium]
MTEQMVALLATEMDEAWEGLRQRLDGLTDDEFFWEPVSGGWTVRTAEDGHWIVDYADPAPDPPPFTSIAWRLVHVAACKVMYHEYAFGRGKLTWDELEIPHTAADAIAWLEEGHARLRTALKQLRDADLEEMASTNWGDQWPTWRILWAMILHDLHHGAEIGCLRDLYRAAWGDAGQSNS